MRQVRRLGGGYQRLQDYHLIIQDELTQAVNALFGSVSFDVVLSGCAVSDNQNGTVNIAPGVVYIGSEVMRFDGAAGVASDGTKALAKGAPATSFPVKFNDTQAPKDACVEAKAIIVNKVSNNSKQLVVTTSLLTFEAYVDARIAGASVKGEVKEFVFKTQEDTDTFLANFDETGLGTSPRWYDWALMNDNNGTVDHQGRVSIGAGKIIDPVSGVEYTFAPGQAGGTLTHKLTVQEMPKFKPKYRTTQTDQTDTRVSADTIKRDDDIGMWLGGWRDGQEIGGDQPHNITQSYVATIKVQKIR